jgi:hypothetical protein
MQQCGTASPAAAAADGGHLLAKNQHIKTNKLAACQ